MKEIKNKFAQWFKLVKAPKYFYIGIGILLAIFLFLPILKLLAIILAITFIMISIFPDHAISKEIHALIEKYKFW